MSKIFSERLSSIKNQYEQIIRNKNKKVKFSKGGVFNRYEFPVLTAGHIPLDWRYDLNEKSNPFLLERLSVNAVLNPGAIKWKDKYLLMARVEGVDRKSFFAIAESDNGVDQFKFRKRPVIMPALNNQETNFYDMRLVAHEDGWIYGLFCTEMRDPSAPAGARRARPASCFPSSPPHAWPAARPRRSTPGAGMARMSQWRACSCRADSRSAR